MKIVIIVVDKLPLSASRCPASVNSWNPLMELNAVECRFTMEMVYMTVRHFVTQRCLNCPLVEEADNLHADEAQE